MPLFQELLVDVNAKLLVHASLLNITLRTISMITSQISQTASAILTVSSPILVIFPTLTLSTGNSFKEDVFQVLI